MLERLTLIDYLRNLIETGDIISELPYKGDRLHIVRHFVDEVGTHLLFESDKKPTKLKINIPHEVDDKLLLVRKYNKEIEEAITIDIEED